ncbi:MULTISPECIES: uracil-DNA glycosylase [Bacillus]|uniref:uracil-DNA glycosylase n=1 Tax=Bacillus TaxID=1386 RepID=UPI00065E9074|nr:uracil-DNA glycosylase [Bacillus smithii]AKP48419.1 Uracil-DNA glycosylase family proteinclostridial type [Bacillus smithii]
MYPESLVKECQKRIEKYPCEGFVYGQGPEKAEIMLVGEAPGETEIHNGIPFSGRAGKQLSEFLDYLGISREDVFITSAVRSRPYKVVKKEKDGQIIEKKYNRTPTQKEILAHAPLLDYNICSIQPKIIVTLGKIALERVTGMKGNLEKIHGKMMITPVQKLKRLDSSEMVWTDRKYKIFPLYHPAAVFYNRRLLQEIYEDLDQLKNYIKEEGIRLNGAM